MNARSGTAGVAIDEAAEIAELQRLYEVQRQVCLDHPYPSYEERIENLGKLKSLVLDYQEKFIEAMSDDFGHRSRGDSGIADHTRPEEVQKGVR